MVARRFRELIESHLSDLAGEASEAEMRLVHRAAGMSLFAELQESYLALAGEERRLLTSLGLRRRQKAAPALADYIEMQKVEPTE